MEGVSAVQTCGTTGGENEENINADFIVQSYEGSTINKP